MTTVRSVGNIVRGPCPSPIESLLELHVRINGLPSCEREYRFDATRKWRADFAWPSSRLLVECEGAIWSGGRHTRGGGFSRDLEKYNAAALAGWTVLRFTHAMVKSGTAIRAIQRFLGGST